MHRGHPAVVPSEYSVAVRIAFVAIVVTTDATGVVGTACCAGRSIIVAVDVTVRDRVGVGLVVIIGVDETAGPRDATGDQEIGNASHKDVLLAWGR